MNNHIKILLLDSNSLVNRAFHALPPLVVGDGLYTNAVYGYMTMLHKLLITEKPTHVCAVFDCRAKTFRHELSADYKATRKPMAEELAMQIPILQNLLTKMGIKVLFKEGYEADDILGTLSKRFKEPTIIVSGDRDVLQLIDDTTTVYHTKRGITEVKKYTANVLKEEGFTPRQIIEFKGLAGDSSDNISGCPGVGEKTAITLLRSYGDIDGVYEHISEINGKLHDNLIVNKDKVYLSKKLATIDTNADVLCELNDIVYAYQTGQDALDYMRYLQFKNLTERFIFTSDSTLQIKSDKSVDNPSSLLKSVQSESVYVSQLEQLSDIVYSIPLYSTIFLDITEDTIIVSTGSKTYYFRTSHDLLGEGIDEETAVNTIAFLCSTDYHNVFFDAKKVFHILSRYNCFPELPYDDILLLAYLNNNTKVFKSKEQLLEDFAYQTQNSYAALLDLFNVLIKKIKEKNLYQLYNKVELPLISVLKEMEDEGFSIDLNVLNALNVKYSSEIEDLLQEIYLLAGEIFNVNSTKQLASVLFDKLGLKHSKKTKTGYSVDAETLEELEHPIVNALLRYRELSKLKSTYLEGMKTLINPITGKVHTCFQQCLTATGRLSSTEPNLQNIPVRKSEGREIRKMFVPSNGNILVTADYSQIELRLLAHFSQEPNLLEAYRNDTDIHALTASKIFNVPLEYISKEMRSSAKAVNFGIIYGISAFGLAKNANVPRYQANEFIKQYFDTYPKVKEYMNHNVELAKKQGYLTTMLGRIRYFPELASSKFNIRSFGERAAMNMPLQGSASDIIKIAMLKVCEALRNQSLRAKLILQVHDELIVDAPKEEEAAVRTILKDCMENAVELSVPLTVNVASGDNWYEAK